MRTFLFLLLSALVLSSCGRIEAPRLFVDQSGFVHNAAGSQPTVRVGVGMTASELLARNPALRGVAWAPSPGSVFDELRVSLQTPAKLNYDDGLLSFSVCAYSTSIDGSQNLKAGVASVGVTVCDPPIDDVEAAIRQAAELLALLGGQRPSVADLATAYRTATQETLTKIGGTAWQNVAVQSFAEVPAPRDDPASMYHLKTLDEARAYFQSRKVNGVAKRRVDGRIDVGLVLVGVFATDKAIVEVGLSGADAFGGENLSVQQRNAIRYQVGMGIRLRPL